MQLNKRKLKSFLAHFYPLHLSYLFGGSFAPILCYHSINRKSNEECNPLHPDLFERHLTFIKENFKVISLRELVLSLRSGSKIPENSLVLTFDDGYLDNFEVAFPILKKYECHATIFVVTDFIDQEVQLIDNKGWKAMNWKQIKKLDESKFVEIAAHGQTHRILSSLSKSSAEKEIVISRDRLEMKLGRPVDLFAFPNGQISDIPRDATKLLTDCGFIAACSTIWRTTQNNSNIFILNRLMVNHDDDISILKKKVIGKYDYLYFFHQLKKFF